MIQNVMKAMHSETGKYAVSFLLGIGLASLFRKVCTDRNCMVFRPPPFDEVTKNTYLHDNKCYQFKDKPTKCGLTSQEIGFA
jgi:hypothetical protein